VARPFSWRQNQSRPTHPPHGSVASPRSAPLLSTRSSLLPLPTPPPSSRPSEARRARGSPADCPGRPAAGHTARKKRPECPGESRATRDRSNVRRTTAVPRAAKFGHRADQVRNSLSVFTRRLAAIATLTWPENACTRREAPRCQVFMSLIAFTLCVRPQRESVEVRQPEGVCLF